MDTCYLNLSYCGIIKTNLRQYCLKEGLKRLADRNSFFNRSEYEVDYLQKSNHLKGINGWCGYLQEYEKCEALLTQVRLIYDKNYN